MAEYAALVTGASSGIGREIAKLLLEKGYEVFGVGRSFEDSCPLKNAEGFTAFTADFAISGETDILIRDVKAKLASEKKKINILINCAGAAFYGLHESLDGDKIHAMVAANIEAPMTLTAAFLPEIRESKGAVINISSVTAKNAANTHGCAYGATKAALTSFGNSLFEEVRKHGVKVCNIHPDLTETELYRNADFTVSGEEMSCLFAREVAEIAVSCLETREGMVLTDITVRPSVNKIVKKQVK